MWTGDDDEPPGIDPAPFANRELKLREILPRM